jgi:hypothetical protein
VNIGAAEEFNEAVLEFFRRHPPAAPADHPLRGAET